MQYESEQWMQWNDSFDTEPEALHVAFHCTMNNFDELQERKAQEYR